MAQLDKIRLSGTTYDIIDSTAVHSLDGYYTSDETNAAITAATNALAESIAEQGYQTSGDVQNAISGKAEASDVQALSGTVTAHTANTDIHVTSEDKTAWNAKADISDIPSVSGYADSVKYNSTSKYVEFYHGGTGGTKVFEYDASPFLIDGMVQNVEIKDVEISGETVTCLVISFNTDAGKQDINIPLTEIFDPSNYVNVNTFTAYTASTSTEIGSKADTTAMTKAISEATSGKADTTAVTQAISEAVSGKVDTNTYTAYTADTATALSGKQETLVSGTNIKTVGGNSLLGSGDVPFPPGMTAEVQGTTLVFS